MTLNVHSSGSGPDLALIHGWGFPGKVWDPVIAGLSANFRVHCVDLPGYGGSRHAPMGSIQDVADAVISALPTDVTLCGWSLGGHVAVAALARHAARVRNLVLVGSTPCFVKRQDWEHGVESTMLDMFAFGLRRDPRGMLGRFAALLNQGDENPLEPTRAITSLAATPPELGTLTDGLDQLRHLDLRPMFPRIRHRTLIVHGDKDPLMPLPAARWAAAALPAATLEVIVGAAHAPFVSRPARFVDALTAFAGLETTC